MAAKKFPKLYTIFDRENKQYFAGFSNDKPTWAKSISAAHPYEHQKDANEDYEALKKLGLDVMVEG